MKGNERNNSEDIRIIAMTVSRNSIGHWSNTKTKMFNINLQKSNIGIFSYQVHALAFEIQRNLWMLICFTLVSLSIHHLLAFVLEEWSVGYKLIFLHWESFSANFHTVPPLAFLTTHQSRHLLSFPSNKQKKGWKCFVLSVEVSVLCTAYTIHWMSVSVTDGQTTWLDHSPWPWVKTSMYSN